MIRVVRLNAPSMRSKWVQNGAPTPRGGGCAGGTRWRQNDHGVPWAIGMAPAQLCAAWPLLGASDDLSGGKA